MAPRRSPGEISLGTTVRRRMSDEREQRDRGRRDDDTTGEPGGGAGQAHQVPDRAHRPRAGAARRLGGVVLHPVGRYELDPETGRSGPRHLPRAARLRRCRRGRALCVDKSLVAQFGLLWRAPPNGLYGVESTETGHVSADEEGFLYGSAQIFFFVLAVGAFITMTMKTGAIETGIGRLALRFRHSPAILVVVLMSVFALGGHDLRHVGGDARLLRAAGPAGPRPGLRPHGRGVDHLPRCRHRRARVDGEPVRHRRRLGRGRHQHQRRARPAGA